MIQPTFLRYFLSYLCIFFYYFYATPKFLPQGRRDTTYKKGRRPRTTGDPKESPQALHDDETAGVGEQLQLFSALRQSPSREQPDPLPAVEWR